MSRRTLILCGAGAGLLILILLIVSLVGGGANTSGDEVHFPQW